MLIDKIDQVIDLLTEEKISYCIIGGVAVLLHGGRASTIDFDLYILADDLPPLEDALKKRRIKISFAAPEQLRFNYKGLQVDVLPADPILGKLVLARAQKKKLGRRKVPVASPEDLIIMKTLADRPIDRRDVEEIKEIFAGKLDLTYLAAQLKKIHRILKT